jgi:hypothetical protein
VVERNAQDSIRDALLPHVNKNPFCFVILQA